MSVGASSYVSTYGVHKSFISYFDVPNYDFFLDSAYKNTSNNVFFFEKKRN